MEEEIKQNSVTFVDPYTKIEIKTILFDEDLGMYLDDLDREVRVFKYKGALIEFNLINLSTKEIINPKGKEGKKIKERIKDFEKKIARKEAIEEDIITTNENSVKNAKRNEEEYYSSCYEDESEYEAVPPQSPHEKISIEGMFG